MDLNETKSGVKGRATENFAGGESFDPDDPHLELAKLTINNLLEDKHYEEDHQSLDRLRQAFHNSASKDVTFPLKLAAYARQEMNLRDVPQVLLVIASNHENTKKFVESFAPEIIQRADEPCTVIATQIKLFGKPVPKPLRKGINKSLFQFDEYQFAKYNKKNRKVNLIDVLNICHPDPSGHPEHEDIFERLVKGDLDDYPEVDPLDPPETWEVVISERGSNKEAWRSVLPKMGMFARIRNLRNMLEEGVGGEEILKEEDLDYIEDSQIYPFRFYQAYRAIKDAGIKDRHVEEWLNDAVETACGNIDRTFKNSLVAVDVSGSMNSSLSSNSKTDYVDISALFGSVIWKMGGRVCAFSDNAQFINPNVNDPIFSVIEKIKQRSGGSTNGWKVIDKVTSKKESFDRIIFLTDMQIWDSTGGAFSSNDRTVRKSFEEYRQKVNPETMLYTVDLSSYGDLLTPEGYQGVYHIQGWTSKIIDFIKSTENKEKMVSEISNFNPTS